MPVVTTAEYVVTRPGIARATDNRRLVRMWPDSAAGVDQSCSMSDATPASGKEEFPDARQGVPDPAQARQAGRGRGAGRGARAQGAGAGGGDAVVPRLPRHGP